MDSTPRHRRRTCARRFSRPHCALSRRIRSHSARRCVLDVVDCAAVLGEAGAVRRQARREKAAARYARELRRREDHLFLLVTAIDGAAAPPPTTAANAETELSTRLRALELSLRGADARLALRIITCGPTADPTVALSAKAALQTEHVWEPAPLYHAAQNKQLATAVRSLYHGPQSNSCEPMPNLGLDWPSARV